MAPDTEPEVIPLILTPDILAKIMPRCLAAKRDEYCAAMNAAMVEAQINTPLRVSAWLANIAHETGELRFWTEDLNYSAESIHATWPKRFLTIGDAMPYAHAPELLANKVYCDRMGNGPQASGDGWRYRGRGPVQLTGREAYLAAGVALGLDLVGAPELAASPGPGFRIAGWFWQWKALAPPADAGEFPTCAKLWNGGYNGLSQRSVYYDRCKLVLSA